ncbi:acetyl-CoA carboxylase biotin carboxylase subunit family protein [Streptomyces sp. NPDC060011]|uniref:ATP-grasp domain-containing protein n=1 Tax=Streptomyces sp. NPDC060011 TaxID=3347037 RepID=UPI00368F3EF9
MLWSPTGSTSADAESADLFARFGEHTPVPQNMPLRSFIRQEASQWRPDGLLAFSERVAADTHAAAFELGLPATEATAVDRLRSKYQQRVRMAESGIPTPRFQTADSLQQLRTAVDIVGLPAVLKPVVGVGSAATYPVDETTDLPGLWRTAEREYLRDPRGNGRMAFVLEERLSGRNQHRDPRYGDQASVESIVQAGQVRHMTVSAKLPLARHFRESGDITPSSLPPHLVNELKATATAAIGALELDHCAVHTEFKLTPDGPRVIEVNGRIGGGVTQLLHYSAAYDVVGELAAVATGDRVARLPRQSRYAAQFLPQPPHTATHVVRAPLPEDLMALPGVVSAEVFSRAGERTDWRRGTSARLARVFAVAEGAEALLATNTELNSAAYFDFTHEGAQEDLAGLGPADAPFPTGVPTP